MPLPLQPESPRVLLRDAAFSKMLDAIQNGPLEPGERLHDAALTTWLGVSRTPIREAIARLESIGLVEMEANRYTRVAVPNRRSLAESVTLLIGFAELAARRVAPGLQDEELDDLWPRLDTLGSAERSPREAVIALAHVADFFVSRADLPSLAEQTFRVAQVAQFSASAGLQVDAWDAPAFVESVKGAVQDRDPVAVSGAFSDLAQSFEDRFAATT